MHHHNNLGQNFDDNNKLHNHNLRQQIISIDGEEVFDEGGPSEADDGTHLVNMGIKGNGLGSDVEDGDSSGHKN